MSEYVPRTPTTDEVRSHWANVGFAGSAEEFDSWLAAHDAEVRRDQIEKDAALVDAESATYGHGESEEGWPVVSLNIAAENIRAQLTDSEGGNR